MKPSAVPRELGTGSTAAREPPSPAGRRQEGWRRGAAEPSLRSPGRRPHAEDKDICLFWVFWATEQREGATGKAKRTTSNSGVRTGRQARSRNMPTQASTAPALFLPAVGGGGCLLHRGAEGMSSRSFSCLGK